MRLSPFGPIFTKELRATARRKRTYWLRSLYLAALFLVLLLVYTSTTAVSVGTSYGSVAARARQEAELGFMFYATFAMFTVFAMPLIGPILTATSISGERLGRTLNVLLMTPITSWQIVSGKLFSRMLAALMLLGLSLPVLAVVRLLGGVELDAMFSTVALCASVALFAAALGLFFSCLMNRAYAVILMSYLTLFILYAMVPFIMTLIMTANMTQRGRPSNFFFATLSVINPMLQVMATVSRMRGFPGVLSWAWCAAFHVAAAAALVWATSALLRRQVKREGEAAGKAPSESPEHVATVAAAAAAIPPPTNGQAPAPLPYAAPPQQRRDRRTRGVGDNPVLWRELRRPLIIKRWQRWVGAILCVALLLLTYIMLAAQWTNELKRSETHIGYAFIFCALTMLLVCVLSGTAISSEKESDTWTLLLTTPLTGYDIVRGKTWGILRRMLWPSALIAAHFLIFTLAGVISWTGCAVVLWTILSFNAIWVATGLYFSLKLKNNTFAVIANLLTPLCLYAAVPVVMLILGNVLLDTRSSRLAEWTTYYLPYLYLGFAVDGLAPRHDWQWAMPNSSLDLPYAESGGMRPCDFVLIVFIIGAIQLLAAWLMLRWIGGRFDRLVARAPQIDALPPAAATALRPPLPA